MILATTTSMRDSGLLDVLFPLTNATGHDVDVVAVGTGAALNLGRSGDADVLIVHAPEAEAAFLEQGHGTSRTVFAWNTFVLLTPEPMNGTLFDVLDAVVEEERCFVSRGDASGTHMKEQALWQAWSEDGRGDVIEDDSGVHPEGDWYLSIGQGMGAAITMADEKRHHPQRFGHGLVPCGHGDLGAPTLRRRGHAQPVQHHPPRRPACRARKRFVRFVG